MNWYGATGTGSTVTAGSRGTDVDSMCGNAVMYDANLGYIVTFGGSTSYQGAAAHSNARTMSLGNPNTVVT
jgi:galactose oxidase